MALVALPKAQNALDAFLNMIRRKENQLKAFTRCLFISVWQGMKSALAASWTDNLFSVLGPIAFDSSHCYKP